MKGDSTKDSRLIVISHRELQEAIRNAVQDGLGGVAGDDDPVLDTKGIAALLCISPRSVAKLASRDKLPVRLVAGRYRALKSEIEHWFKQRPRSKRGRASRQD